VCGTSSAGQPGFWAFTFSYAAAATDALRWITLKHPPGTTAYAAVVITAITGFILAIAARTVVAALQGQLSPRRPRTKLAQSPGAMIRSRPFMIRKDLAPRVTLILRLKQARAAGSAHSPAEVDISRGSGAQCDIPLGQRRYLPGGRAPGAGLLVGGAAFRVVHEGHHIAVVLARIGCGGSEHGLAGDGTMPATARMMMRARSSPPRVNDRR
jgi:hypothetical protein